MKVSVSIPDDAFDKQHASDEITDAMNAVCEKVADANDKFVAAAARRVIENTEW